MIIIHRISYLTTNITKNDEEISRYIYIYIKKSNEYDKSVKSYSNFTNITR